MAHSDYMHFAKTRTLAQYNLASSGVADCQIEELALESGVLALHGANPYGYDPLVTRIASRFGIEPSCVVTPGGGTSFVNHLALAAILNPGDEVLIESPTYPLITDTLRYLRTTIRTFPRSAAAGWLIHASTVNALITPRTRLVILTNLHNPSCAFTDAETIDAISDAASGVGAYVLVDEVYRELLFTTAQTSTSFHPNRNIVTTSSLTKAYGLSGLRCGWCFAPADLALRMRRLNDLFGVVPAHPAERMAVAALDRLDIFRARANSLIATNRAAYKEILSNHPALEQSSCPHGTTMFPRLKHTDGDALYDLLMGSFDTSLVPGRYFGCSDHVRIGLGGDPVQTREGLRRMAAALR